MKINYTILPNGDLKITADNEARSELARFYRNGRNGWADADLEVRMALQDSIAFIPDRFYSDLGALTSAPILSDYFVEDDDGTPIFGERFWWFPDYQLVDEWRTLANTGRVVFENATTEAT